MTLDDIELVNSTEAANWHRTEDGVQVLVCDHCGFVGCKVGDWVRIVRLASSLLWVPAVIDPADDWASTEFEAPRYLRQHGAVMIRQDDWNEWRSAQPSLPEPSAFPPASRRDIAVAWLLETPTRAAMIEQVRTELLRIVAGSRLDRDAAIAAVDAVATWLEQPAGDDPLSGYDLRSVDAAPIETISLDGLPEWQPLAYADAGLGPAFGGGVVLEPPPLTL